MSKSFSSGLVGESVALFVSAGEVEGQRCYFATERITGDRAVGERQQCHGPARRSGVGPERWFGQIVPRVRHRATSPTGPGQRGSSTTMRVPTSSSSSTRPEQGRRVLVEPAVSYRNSYLAARREDPGLPQSWVADGLRLEVELDFVEFVRRLRADADPQFPRPPGWVPCTTLWWVRGCGVPGSRDDPASAGRHPEDAGWSHRLLGAAVGAPPWRRHRGVRWPAYRTRTSSASIRSW